MKWENNSGEKRDNCIVICKVKELYGELSNMHNGFPLTVNGKRIRSSEALYQALRFPHQPDWQDEILAARHAMGAKMKAKKDGRRRNHSRADWNTIQVSVMEWVLRTKIAQHNRIFSILRGSNQQPIVEKSAKDHFWGAIEGTDGVLRGENRLGELLMKLREEIALHRADAEKKMKVVSAPNIEGLLLLGEPVKSWSG